MRIECTIYVDDSILETALKSGLNGIDFDEAFDLIGAQIKFKVEREITMAFIELCKEHGLELPPIHKPERYE